MPRNRRSVQLSALRGAALRAGRGLATALGLAAALGAAAAGAAPDPGREAAGAAPAPAAMAEIPAGAYVPLYAVPAAAGAPSVAVRVPRYLLDRFPVTNAEYLEFVQAHPKWQKSAARPLFVDGGYLRHWRSDLSPGAAAPPRSPVTNVSWFAARAYCAWQGKRLPSTAEWERAAAADEQREDGSRDAAFRERILRWYAVPATDVLPPVGSVYRNLWGVHDLHGLVWEWTEDFSTALGTGESRQDADLERRLFCGSGAAGAAGNEDYAAFMRYGLRGSLSADYTLASLGFRCARSITASPGTP